MTDSAAMAAAPDFLEIDGKEYTLTPLTIGQIAEIEKRLTRRLHSQVIASARDANREEGVTHDEAVMLLDRAHTHADRFLKLSFAADPDGILAAQVATLHGIAMVMATAMKKNHPDITPEWILESLDKETLEKRVIEVLRASGFDAVEVEEAPAAETKSEGDAEPSVSSGDAVCDSGPEVRVDGEPDE